MNKHRIIIGIDPGLNGAIAVINTSENIICSYSVNDIPTIKVQKSVKLKTMIDLENLKELIGRILGQSTFLNCHSSFEAWVEDVHAMPMQGVTSMFSMGRSLGNIEMALTDCHIPIHWVTPQKWKKEVIFGAGSDKLISIDKAKELFPLCKYETERGRKLDGRAEAMLIAEYGRRQTI